MRASGGVFLLLLLAGCACSGGERDGEGGRRPPAEEEDGAENTPRSRSRLPGAPTPTPDAAPDPAKLVYVVSRDEQLFSFDPRQPGLEAYQFVGKLTCKSSGTPQSMAVDRGGIAWVFYSKPYNFGELFHVNVRDASCKPAPYRHGNQHYQLGMGFTAVDPGSPDERLYVISPGFGLATMQMPALTLRKTGDLVGGAELTGGADAKLFHFGSSNGVLSEIDLSTRALKPLHTFYNLQGVGAWAFARYAGRFYVFTSQNEFTPSRTTMFDPKTKKESIRDENVGFVIVGAGQSTKVPPTDGGSEVSGEPPPP